ncbi:hypothetical protein B0T17DRAFT_530522 [Bombardia bombarda]|uniref:Ankyrin repeat protein n=1 Tax=Bombardia bombarda TaxID=252184 RepID=A0AA39WZM9_9PEZI|nr:hypothetical protein B0T17DRAFT_530522 [Bombardia bombarda]
MAASCDIQGCVDLDAPNAQPILVRLARSSQPSFRIIQTINMLLEHGVDANAMDSKRKMTAIHWEVSLECGPDPSRSWLSEKSRTLDQ